VSDDVAETLRRAWTTALDATVDDGDDFFALGGDSLRAASVAADLHQHRGVLIEPGWLYDHPRFTDAHASLTELITASPHRPAFAMIAGVREGDHPLSHQQEGLLAVIDLPGASALGRGERRADRQCHREPDPARYR
jgi:hypothetical protein